MLDRDLADLYGVTTSTLKRQVKRNIERFPDDFMFELTREEAEDSRCQNGILNKRGYNIKYLPFAFTENGVAMLSSVLRSPKAIGVNIQIMRVFTTIRQQAFTQNDILNKLSAIDKTLRSQQVINQKTERQMKVIFEAIRHILEPPGAETKRFGFIVNDETVSFSNTEDQCL